MRTSPRLLLVVAVATAVVASGTSVPGSSAVVPRPGAVAGDPTAHRTASGEVLYADPADPAGTPRRPVVRPPAIPRGVDAMRLHSFPGARLTLLIDVDGFLLQDTYWNNEGGVSAHVTPPWDPAGDGPGLSSADQAAIYDVFTRVAADFSPWVVDVTTQDPGAAALDQTGPNDTRYGARIVITPDEAVQDVTACAGTCRGLSFRNSFERASNQRYYNTAFTFPQAITQGTVGITATTSHEAGHTLGLRHDTLNGDVNPTYRGHDPWAPIMGASSFQPVTQWSNGSYAGATNTEDDVAIISSHLPVRPDENSFNAVDNTAEFHYPTTVGYVVYDREDRDGDVDYFRIRACRGPVTVTIPDTLGTNLDARLSLLTPAPQAAVLAVVDPLSQRIDDGRASGMGGQITYDAGSRPRDLVVGVQGTGRQGTDPTTGYDNYGSLGRYNLRVTGCGKGLPGSPRALAAQQRRSGVRIRWQAPAYVGGSIVDYYLVQVDKRGSRKVDATPRGRPRLTVQLKPGRHRVAVFAVNDSGRGAPVKRRFRVQR